MLDTVARVRAALLAQGFVPIAVATGDKNPVNNGWNMRQDGDASLPVALGVLNTGVRCGGLRAVDIDVDDPARAGQLRELALAKLGRAPIRWRKNSSRILLLYRAAEGNPKKRFIVSKTFKSVDGKFEKVEVLGDGQQFVAYGKHPTGAELRWEPKDPTNFARGELIAVTEEQIGAFLAKAAGIIDALGETAAAPVVKQKINGHAFAPSPPMGAPTQEQIEHMQNIARRSLANIASAPPGTSNGTINREAHTLAGLVAAGLSDEGLYDFALNMALERASRGDNDPRETRKTFESGWRSGAHSPLVADCKWPAAAVEQASADCARAMAKQGVNSAQPRLNGVQTRLVSEKDGIVFDTSTGEVLSSAPIPNGKGRADWVSLIMRRGGIVAEIAAYILRTSRRPQPRFAVAAAVATIATAAGRQFKTPTDCGINLFIVNLVETGKGKDAILKGINNIFSAAKLDWRMLHNAAFKSEVAIFLYAKDKPVLMALIDEFGDIVRSISSNNASQSQLTILSTLRQFYDGGTIDAPAAACRTPLRVIDPSLSLFTASTPDQFYTAVGNTEARNGFLNRFVAFRGDVNAPRREPDEYADQVPSHIVQGVLAIADKHGEGYRMEQGDEPEKMPFERVAWTDEAKAAWTAYDIECEKAAETDKDRETLGPRCGQNAIRIASVLAIADNLMFPCVTAEHVAIAQAMIEDSYYAMAGGFNAHVTDSAMSAVCDKILDRIEKAGGIMTYRDLFRGLQRAFRTVKEFKDSIDVLVEAQRIEILTTSPERGGKTVISYRILENKIDRSSTDRSSTDRSSTSKQPMP